MTKRQRRIVQFFLRFARSRGRWPTIREVGDSFEISSTNGVRAHFMALRKKGVMFRTGKGAHAWGVVGYKFQLVKEDPC